MFLPHVLVNVALQRRKSKERSERKLIGYKIKQSNIGIIYLPTFKMLVRIRNL